MTNYEWLKAMSIENIARVLMGSDGEAELSAFICMGERLNVPDSEVYCPHVEIIEGDEPGKVEARFPCHKCMERWLAQEAKEGYKR